MLPSFAATTMFYYEWTRHESESNLLTFAIVCLVMGVIFGSLIVRSTSNASDKEKHKNTSAKQSASAGDAQVHEQEPQNSTSASVENAAVHLQNPVTSAEASSITQAERTAAPVKDEEAPVLNSDLSTLFDHFGDTVSGAAHAESHSCPSDRWTEPSRAPQAYVAEISDSRTVEELLNHADILIAKENFDEAIKIYDSVTRLDANNFDAWFLKAVALRKKHRCQDAIYCINFALSIKRNSIVAMVEKGECLLQMDRADQAIVWFDKALSQDKIAIAPWIGKARCLTKIGETTSAIACYEKILSLQPDHAEAQSSRAELASKQGRRT